MPNPMALMEPLRNQGGTGKEEPEFTENDDDRDEPDRTEDDEKTSSEGSVQPVHPVPEEAAGG